MKKILFPELEIKEYAVRNNLMRDLVVVYNDGSIKHFPVFRHSYKMAEGKPNAVSTFISPEYKNDFQDKEIAYGAMIIYKSISLKGIIHQVDFWFDSFINVWVDEEQHNIVIPENIIDKDISEVFYNNDNLETPEVFTNLMIPNSDGTVTSLVEENNIIDNIEKRIIKGTLHIDKDHTEAISEVNLDISASWLSLVEGEIEISSKVANRFSGNKINTLTPFKLEANWPHFGEKIVCKKSSRPSKYYVGVSHLTRDNELIHMPSESLTTPTIMIEADTSFSLKRYWYNHKLSIAYGYEQFRKESVKTTISNPFSKNICAKAKNISINLKSVQNFIPNIYSETFFGSDIGKKAYKYVMKMIESYLIMSSRNIKISFTIPYTKDISTKNWIKLNSYVAKITKIKTDGKTTMDVTAMAFENHDLIKNQKIPIKDLPKVESRNITDTDIIHDITVENDGVEQAAKLIQYIDQLKLDQKINKINYKQIINKFLNENNTKINIIVKPLKNENCIHNIINI